MYINRNVKEDRYIKKIILITMASIEDEQHGREQVETDLVQYLKDKLVRFHAKISSYGTNVSTARGIQKLSSQFEILVFGPARVGKSTLIKQVSGDTTIATSAKPRG
jgi:putative ribosome biogenesis GTPase RsgA